MYEEKKYLGALVIKGKNLGSQLLPGRKVK
jgi:hypothetical protein